MTKAEISKNDFFYQFTIKLCSSLDLKKAVYQCSLFFQEIIPFDLVNLALITDQPHTLKHIFHINPEGEILEERMVTVPPEAWENMQKHLKSNKILLMYAKENRKYAESLVNYSPGVLETYDLSMPLVFKGQPLGFFVIRGKNEFTEAQLEFISSVKEPITHSVAASIRYEQEQKQQKHLFSVDLIFNRIKLLFNIATDKKLAEKLDILPSSLSNCRLRNSIPYDKIISFCHSERIPTDFIFMHEPFILNSKNKEGLYKVASPEGVEYADKTAVEDLLKLPHGSLGTYIEKCATDSKILPPIEKLQRETLKVLHEALHYRDADIDDKTTRTADTNIPLSSGNITQDMKIEMTGSFICFSKEWKEKLSLSKNVFAYTLADDSMAPTLIKEDVVVIDPDEKVPKQNGLYAVSLGDRLFIKRLMPTGRETLTMICDNKIYPPDSLHPDNIVGEVVWYGRHLRPFK